MIGQFQDHVAQGSPDCGVDREQSPQIATLQGICQVLFSRGGSQIIEWQDTIVDYKTATRFGRVEKATNLHIDQLDLVISNPISAII
jgi:hypothetical protein